MDVMGGKPNFCGYQVLANDWVGNLYLPSFFVFYSANEEIIEITT